MSLSLLINNKILNYTDSGNGKVVVLLHGYLESIAVWKDFASELSNSFRVICIDIPGHGQSDTLYNTHSMEQLATCIYQALNTLQIKKCFLIGHSMGGYLTLMFHKLYPEMLSGFCLFHSHPFADSEEKKLNRLRETDFVRDGKKNLIASVNIPNTYATENVPLFAQEIENAKRIVEHTPEQGIIANIHAMITRPDLSESLANSSLPFLFIAGKKDNLIDFETIIPKIKLPDNSETLVLLNSGHMGFIEEKNKSLKYIIQFIESKTN